MKTLLSVYFFLVVSSLASDWHSQAPREEIAPTFSRNGEELVIQAGEREGENGFWERRFPVVGGTWMEFSALKRGEKLDHERRSAMVRLEFLDSNGKMVPIQEESVTRYFNRPGVPLSRPEFPRDRDQTEDGWTRVEDRYLVPEGATQAKVQLHLRWAPQGKITWKNVSLTQVEAPESRTARLAAVHLSPRSGESPNANLQLYEPLIAEAAAQEADLVCLGECITIVGLGLDFADVAEPIPGPSTAYLGNLAKQHDLYIVAGLVERDAHLIYNVAVMMGPAGEVVGKYRKVTLPREEIAKGICPGSEYPVFETRFGKVGMMVCYDVFFPEVARKLAMNGAEVIAMPIWGGNPLLAQARACENQVYLVSSTYTSHEDDWMKSGIWDREGRMVQKADEWGTVVVQEVDLSQRTHWRFLGDFQARIAREGPVWEAEE